MTPDEIRDLPASWYASQPIPVRLLEDLERDWPLLPGQDTKIPRALELALHPRRPRVRRSLVEQTHARHVGRLLRR